MLIFKDAPIIAETERLKANAIVCCWVIPSCLYVPRNLAHVSWLSYPYPLVVKF